MLKLRPSSRVVWRLPSELPVARDESLWDWCWETRTLLLAPEESRTLLLAPGESRTLLLAPGERREDQEAGEGSLDASLPPGSTPVLWMGGGTAVAVAG